MMSIEINWGKLNANKYLDTGFSYKVRNIKNVDQ